MSDVHPYPQDVTADPFIVFGGLLSRKVVNAYIEKLNPSQPEVFSSILKLANQCSKEHAFQQGIEDTLTNNGIACKKWRKSPRWDRVIGNEYGVEIKLDKHRFDPQFWQGSGDDKNAVEQARRYLDECGTYDWAILTNGSVFRLMHKESGFNFLDIWICDTNQSGPTKQASFLDALMRDRKILENLMRASKEERHRFNLTFEKNVHSFWEKYKLTGNRTRNVALVEAVLLIAFYRYLEDCGIFPIHEEKFQMFSLNKPPIKERLIKALKELKKQTFLGKGGSNLESLVSDETIKRIDDLFSELQIYGDFISLFWDTNGPVDLSDLKISFFGDAYQLFAKKSDINGVDGQYFTGSELARETALYFIEDGKGLAEDEVLYDPFVGSGQLLRALVPYFHVLLQGEVRKPSIIEGMRKLSQRLVGTDVDAHACWLARLCLTVVTSERNKPLIDFNKQIKHADVFEACFGYTESKWQENLGIKGRIRGIITNPPWRRMRQTANELYSIETESPAPLRSNNENWSKYQKWLDDGGRVRASEKSEELKKLSKKHKETFNQSGQREVNLAISGLEFSTRIPGTENKRWVIFMPDCFFIGQNKIRQSQNVNVRKYYSYPYNEHFKDTDSVMKFGIVFGGRSNSPKIYCHPMGSGQINVKPIFQRFGVLPIFGSVEEAYGQSLWFTKANKTNRWKHGEFHETETPKKGATLTGNRGIPVRGAKKCNDKKTHSCLFNQESVSYWSNWKLNVSGSRVIVRDKRSNTKTQKILWVGTHIPGTKGVPKNCALSNAWNYLKGTRKEVNAIEKLLNSPIADMALRSIGSKRNINPKHLNLLGLPELSSDVQTIIAKSKTFEESTAAILLFVFELSNADAKKIFETCAWINEKEQKEILDMMSLSSKEEAKKLEKTSLKRKRGQLKRVQKKMAKC